MTTNTGKWDKFADEIFEAMSGYVERGLKAVCERGDSKLAALEKRVAELEQRPEVSYCGVYDPEAEYCVGNFVTFRGSVWHAGMKTKGVTPGDGAIWTLAVKHGKNAR